MPFSLFVLNRTLLAVNTVVRRMPVQLMLRSSSAPMTLSSSSPMTRVAPLIDAPWRIDAFECGEQQSKKKKLVRKKHAKRRDKKTVSLRYRG